MLDIYIASIPSNIEISDVYPPQRNSEILEVKNEKVRAEKYCVWRLLINGVEFSLGRSFNSFKFKKMQNGKWVCDEFCFSLSHGDGMLAVAISDTDVGIDIQRVKPVTEALAKRTMSNREYTSYLSLDDNEKDVYFTTVWAKKEAIYKRGGYESFIPSVIDTFEVQSDSFEYFNEGERYIMAYSADTQEVPKIIKLKI